MKKLFTFLAVIIFSFALSSCGGQKAQDTSDTSAQVDDKAQQEEAAKEDDSGFFTSIKDALSKSIPIKCIYTDESGLSMNMYIKGNVMRADTIKKSETDLVISEIIKDNKVYIWSENSPKGMAIDFSKMQPDDNTLKMGETPIHSSDDIIAEIDRQKQNCTREVVSDSIFEVPANITFLGL